MKWTLPRPLNKGQKAAILFLLGAVCALVGLPAPARMREQGTAFRRIVSLGPSLTESLFLLGAGDRVVGVTDRCRKPPETRRKEKVGSVVDVNVEKIASLKPDLVLATSLTSPKSVAKLKQLGIPVVLFKAPTSFSGLCAQFLELAKLVGRESHGARLLRKVETQMQDLRRWAAGRKRPRVVIQAGAKPLWIAPKESFLNDFIELAGGDNVGPPGSNGRISREKVLESRPEVILITTMGLVGEEEREQWKKYPSLPAVVSDRIYIVESDRFCSPTVVSFVQTLKEVALLIHGKER